MEVPLDDGHHVLIEVDRAELPEDLVLAGARPYENAAPATETLDSLLDKVKPTVKVVAEWAKAAGPDECTVEFGLKMGGETGVIIAKGTAEVNFVLKLTWKR